MKCRAAVFMLVVLTAAGAAAQSGTNGLFQISDPTQFFGNRPAALNRNNATFSIDFETTNAKGDLTSFDFHSDSTTSAQDSWVFTVENDAGMTRGTYQINGASITAFLSNFNASCRPVTGSFTIGTNISSSGSVTQISGSFILPCTSTQTVTGTFNLTTNLANSPGGGGGGGGGGLGGGFGTGGVGRIPGLGSLPSGTGGSGGSGTPSAPPEPSISVSATSNVIELNSGETAVVRLNTAANSTFASGVTLSAEGAPGLIFTFNPERIKSPGNGESVLTIGTGDAVQAGDQKVDIVARGDNGVVGRTSISLRVICDPPFILGVDQPKHTTIAKGNTAQLTVKASGSGPFTYQWYEGHRGSLVFPIAGATGATFTTPALNASTEYWVRVANPCGAVDSQNVSVNVNP